MMKMAWAVRVSFVAAPSHGASDTRGGKQHKMLRLQEDAIF